MSAVSVRGAVLAARRRWLLARWLESGLLGVGVLGGALAAATLSGARPLAPGALQAALLCGLLAALTLAVERRRSTLGFARRLDARLGERGALLTAFECEQRGAEGALAALLVRGVVARLVPERLAATRTPPSPAFLALALLGAALAALAIDRAAVLPGPGTSPARARAVLGRVAQSAGDPLGPDAGELARALEELEGLDAAALAQAPELAPALAALEGLVERGPAPTVTIGRLDAATRERVQAALERLRAPARPGADAAGGSGPASLPEERSQEPALAGAGAGRTMSGSLQDPPVPPTPPSTAAAGAAPAPAGRWWPRRHDAVIALYVERTAEALEARPADPR